MTPELYQRLKPLYDDALDAPKEQRAQFVDEACGDDPELRRHLEALLAAHDESTGPLDAPLVNLRNFDPSKQRTLADGDLVLGRFKIVRILGSGGMGEVYEAEDRFLHGVHIALKTILPHAAGDPDLQKRFEREVLLAREVTHPNLCPIHTIFHCDDPPPGYLFLPMKLLPGQTLSARLREPPLMTKDEGLAVLRQTSLGIAAIHAAGIIHRDIKPNNIMVDGSGAGLRLWITDFGLARAYETESTVSLIGAVAGTPGYIAPELFLGHPPSQASDLFALGVVLHEVFAGEKPTPVPGTHSYNVSPRLATQKIPALSVRLIAGCLQDDPQRRCTAFARTLEVIDPKLAHNYYSSQDTQVRSRRRFVGAAAAGVCAIAGAAWWKWDDIDEIVEDVFEPLPEKRFVALLGWPPPGDPRLEPTITAVVDAVGSELARAEAKDHNLFIIPQHIGKDVASLAQVNEVRESVGANLVLSASAILGGNELQLLLRVLDPAASRTLRQRTIRIPMNEQLSLPNKAVLVAADLLDISKSELGDERSKVGTNSAEAYAAFQIAEGLRGQENDSGLDGAVEKYKQAIEIDPRYALANAKLALAYFRLYILHRDPAALVLARANCHAALSEDPNLVDAHLALASVLDWTGDKPGALREISKALSIDPGNPGAMLVQGQEFTRCDRWRDAENTFARLQTARPNFWLAHEELGFAYGSDGKYALAADEFRAASLAAPKQTLPLANLSAISLQMGNLNDALDFARRCLALAPNVPGLTVMAAVLRCQGKFDQALAFSLKAVSLNPDYPDNWLNLGDTYSGIPGRRADAKDAFSRAAKLLEETVHTDPTDGPIWMSLAFAQAKTGESEESLKSLRTADDNFAGDLDSQLLKVRTLELLGRRDEAFATASACLTRGATLFQFRFMPDISDLRNDPRFKSLLSS